MFKTPRASFFFPYFAFLTLVISFNSFNISLIQISPAKERKEEKKKQEKNEFPFTVEKRRFRNNNPTEMQYTQANTMIATVTYHIELYSILNIVILCRFIPIG